MNLDVSTGVVKTFSSIIQKLESAEGFSTNLGNSVSNLRSEINAKRHELSGSQIQSQQFIKEISNLTDKGSIRAIEIMELLNEKKFLVQRINDAKLQVSAKRKELDNLKAQNNDIVKFTESLEAAADEQSLLVQHATTKNSKLGTKQLASDDPYEDLTGVDFSEFAFSQ